MSLITTPQNDKITKTFVEDFISENCFKKKKMQSENSNKYNDKKFLIEAYNLLRPQLKNYMDSIVTNTWLALKDVLGNYRFKMEDGNFTSIAYNTFSIQAGNRDIDTKHVIEVIENYEKKWYQYNVWIVNEEWRVINGQHRLIGAQIIKERSNGETLLPFIFDIVPESGLELIKTTNSISSDRKWLDFLSSWVNSKNKHYIELNTLYKDVYEEKVAISELVWMLDGNNAKIAKERFNDGNFIMDKERIAKAKEFIEIAITFFNSLGTKKNKISSIRFRVLNKIWQLEWFNPERLGKVINSNNIPSIEKLKTKTNLGDEELYDSLMEAYNHSLREKGRILHMSRKDIQRKAPTYQFMS
jgi:hypothetical protein